MHSKVMNYSPNYDKYVAVLGRKQRVQARAVVYTWSS